MLRKAVLGYGAIRHVDGAAMKFKLVVHLKTAKALELIQ